MPELPEIEAFKKYVELHALGKVVADVTSSDTRVIKGITLTALKKNLQGDIFVKTSRMGKFLIISLQKSPKKLVMHFGLTGSLVYTKEPEKIRFSVVQFIFKDHSVLHFTSVRKFEKIWLVDDVTKIHEIKDLGPDALEVTQKDFFDLLEKNKSKNIKAFFMDQSIIAGIGNEYSDEILFQAGVDPHHKIRDLSVAVRKKIYTTMRAVLKYAIQVRIKNIKNMSEYGFFTQHDRGVFKKSYLQAHRHIDMICPKNKNHRLKTATIAGRTTYYCPVDQK